MIDIGITLFQVYILYKLHFNIVRQVLGKHGDKIPVNRAM